MIDWNDNPLEDEEHDELGRGPFAALVAHALLAENKKRATVVGLTGGWGTGKSTVANFVIARVLATDPSINVVRFEPWMVSTPEALAREFFKELGKAVLPKDNSKESREKRAKFYRYTALALDALALTADATGSLGVPLAGAAGKALRSSRKAMEIAVKGLAEQAQQPTLREARDSLSKTLVDLEKPVVVMIDDIDRLDCAEVRTVFQLIKACADFPNVRYLLLYDHDQVVFSLSDSVHDSNAFVEKIIGQAFHLPHTTILQRQLTLTRFLEGLDLHSVEGNAKERLHDVFLCILLPGLKTVRQMKRYVGTVQSLLPGVTSGNIRNVDPADFLALEFLRQTVPTLYEVLRDEYSPVPGGIVQEYGFPEELSRVRKAARDAATPPAEPLKTLSMEVLRLLQDNITDTDGVGRTWGLPQHRDRRFASIHWTHVYFGYDSGRASMREEEWLELRRQLADGENGDKWLVFLDEEVSRTRFSNIVADRAHELSVVEAMALLTGVLTWGESQSNLRISSWEDPRPLTVVRRISAACLSRLLKEEPAEDVIGEVWLCTKALCCLSYVCAMENNNITVAHRGGEWCTREQMESVRNFILPLLLKACDSEDFFQSNHVEVYFDSLRGLLGPNEYSNWFESRAKLPEWLASYVNTVLASRWRNNVGTVAAEPGSQYWISLQALDRTLLTQDGIAAREHYFQNAAGIKMVADDFKFEKQEACSAEMVVGIGFEPTTPSV
ncbi:MAG: hypothetical protein JNJ45_02605 [Chthonomonas sp.]|nr:hypothetical protein [Chthonomonas sp.]